MPSRPNILFILADQHRADGIGAYGNSEVRTPDLDALARDGVRFDQCFCPFPVCTPSRYSILSGLYVHEHRGWTNHCTLPPSVETFPAILRKAGYRTAAAGKMHFTPTYLDVGFDQLALAEQDGPGRWDDDYHRDLRAAGLVDANDLEDQRSEYRKQARPEYRADLGALASNLPAKWHSTEWIAAKSIEFLDQWGPEGNLLMVGFVKPHHPFDPPAEWCDAYDPNKLTLLPGWTPQCLARDLAKSKGYFPHESLTEASVRRAAAYYYATIEHIDAQVGRMVELLKRKGLYENTLIVYTSDHGEYLGFHHLLLKGGPMYDPLMRVPLIVKYPTNAQAGAESKAFVSNVDLAPTLLCRAGCRPASAMRGLDLVANPKGRDVVFAESGRDQVMARTRRYKLLRSGKQSLLFDLERDPLEMADRYEDSECCDARVELESAIGSWRGAAPLQDVYVDENAPVIKGPNVPPRDDGHRESILAYYAKKMEEWRASAGS